MSIKDKLEAIFAYYNLKYKLNCRLGIYSWCSTCYDITANKIYISLTVDKSSTYFKRIGYLKNKYSNALVLILLHEIKHAIEAKKGLLQSETRLKDFDYHLYKAIANYHDNAPFEKRADYFAVKEIYNFIG
jgi:hypothetical protein